MKTLEKVPLSLFECEYIPPAQDMAPGVFYFSREYNVSNHLCPCGCGMQTPLPHNKDGWAVTILKGRVSVTPSILHRTGCKSHYIITNGVANLV